jgi:hypothetical protein
MMTETYLKIEKTRDRLVAVYQSLVEIDRSIVQLFAVIYTPVSRTLFFECFQQTGLWGLKPLTAVAIKPYLDRLLVSDLLIPHAKNTLQIHPLIAEVAAREAVSTDNLTVMAQVVATNLPVAVHRYNQQRQFESRGEFIREVRLGLYLNDLKFINEQFDAYYNSYGRVTDPILPAQLWYQTCNNPFDPNWFATLDPALAETVWYSILDYSIDHLAPVDGAFTALQVADKDPTKPTELQLRVKLVEQLLFRGKVSEAKQALESFPATWRDRVALLWGWWHFLRGDDTQAIGEYETSLKALKKGAGKRKTYFMTAGGIFFILALIRRGEGVDLRAALEHIKIAVLIRG